MENNFKKVTLLFVLFFEKNISSWGIMCMCTNKKKNKQYRGTEHLTYNLKIDFARDIDCFDNLISNYNMSRSYLKFKTLMGLKHNIKSM